MKHMKVEEMRVKVEETITRIENSKVSLDEKMKMYEEARIFV